MKILSENIKVIRKRSGLTQQELADLANVKRGSITAYEKGRAIPPLDVVLKLSEALRTNVDDLVSDHSRDQKSSEGRKLTNGVSVITVDKSGNENVELVDQKAYAGYVKGFQDADFISELPKIDLPFLNKNRTYRAFEIVGDSMLPVKPKSIIVAEKINTLDEIKDGQCYIVVTRDEGIAYKRLYNLEHSNGSIILFSDNTFYNPYKLKASSILEIWKKKKIITDEIDEAKEWNGAQMTSVILTMQKIFRGKKK